VYSYRVPHRALIRLLTSLPDRTALPKVELALAAFVPAITPSSAALRQTSSAAFVALFDFSSVQGRALGIGVFPRSLRDGSKNARNGILSGWCMAAHHRTSKPDVVGMARGYTLREILRLQKWSGLAPLRGRIVTSRAAYANAAKHFQFSPRSTEPGHDVFAVRSVQVNRPL
jgi:hypothetical protein